MNKAARTKQFIVEKTAPVFNEKGYAGTSLTDMTNATGLTKGSIYGNFANKDEVALAAFEYNIRQITDIIRQEKAKHDTYRGKLLAYVHTYNNFLKHPFPAGGCPILNTATEADDTHPALKERAAWALGKWKEAVMQDITRGILQGEFDKDTPVEQAALTILAMVEGCLMITKLTGKMHYRNAIMQSLETFIREL
ncbi:TetR/AcrR family transcriptional regulator [Chitinophaga qingshengii]|uniref:TetR/AcrR family transcriptional regulator n=1 Tax=Chitinophaga qingshengii TaxID=1569794 RepID=A0ABR7TR52_9BACT|nr:TetR/AcrR family transcriptional regulator [Chitinophaga qingshengii]MBC9932053.1 TetR/AcrR family transcriptional regulator [Chitinophaga qingshengii]